MNKRVEATTFDERTPPGTPDDVVLGEKLGTSRDVEDMKRMGKEQLFKVNIQGHLIICVVG
jgi:hypothetical protein